VGRKPLAQFIEPPRGPVARFETHETGNLRFTAESVRYQDHAGGRMTRARVHETIRRAW